MWSGPHNTIWCNIRLISDHLRSHTYSSVRGSSGISTAPWMAHSPSLLQNPIWTRACIFFIVYLKSTQEWGKWCHLICTAMMFSAPNWVHRPSNHNCVFMGIIFHQVQVCEGSQVIEKRSVRCNWTVSKDSFFIILISCKVSPSSCFDLYYFKLKIHSLFQDFMCRNVWKSKENKCKL